MCWTNKKRLALVGDAGCGKTTLAVRLSQDIFIEDYFATDFDDYSAEIGMAPHNTCRLTMLDTSGSHEQTEIRSLAYEGCNVVLVCFDLTDMETFDNVQSHWLPELEKYCPGVPFVVAGLKRDAMCEDRCSCGGNCCKLSENDLRAFIGKSGAVAYVECSALTSENVEETFRMSIKATHRRKNSAMKLVSSFKKRLSVHLKSV